MPVQRFVTRAKLDFDERLCNVFCRSRRKIDLPAQALGFAIRRQRLVYDDPVDRTGGHCVKFNGAA